MNKENIKPKKHKYFYTVLFLNNYFPKKMEKPADAAETKVFDVCIDSNDSAVKWLNENELWLRHNLKLPITVEMWNADKQPIFYCPILKKDVENFMVGNISIESDVTIKFDFTGVVKPSGNEVFKVAVRSLPLFDLEQPYFPKLPLDETVVDQRGMAIVFRRNSLDALFDLIAEFDESYWHSMEETYDLRYLTELSCYQDCFFAGKYTSELEDIMDLIDVNRYEVKYSWENPRIQDNPNYL